MTTQPQTISTVQHPETAPLKPHNVSGADRDDQLVALWLSGRPDNTSRAYAHEVLRFYRFTGKPLARVTASDLYAFAESLARAGLKPASQYRALSAVKSLFGFAHGLGYIAVDPAVSLRMPKPMQDRAAKLLSAEAVPVILDHAGTGRNRLICETLYWLALRESELIGLNAGDLHGRVISMRGKGDKIRHLAMPGELAQALSAHADGLEPDAPLFQSRSGKRLSPSDVYRIVRSAGERAGYKISPHWLRHAHASHAADGGAPLHVIQQTLGHANPATTGVYMHAKPTDGSALYLKKQPRRKLYLAGGAQLPLEVCEPRFLAVASPGSCFRFTPA